MKPSDTMKSLSLCFKAGQRPLLHGVPGIGKSEMVLQAADVAFSPAYGFSVEAPGIVSDKSGQVHDSRWPRPWYREFRTSQRDAVDLTGLPAANDGKTVWLTPEFMPSDPRVFFLDEINRVLLDAIRTIAEADAQRHPEIPDWVDEQWGPVIEAIEDLRSRQRAFLALAPPSMEPPPLPEPTVEWK